MRVVFGQSDEKRMFMKLPAEFTERLQLQLGSDGVSAYAESLEKNLSHALRVNRLKLDTEEFDRVSPFALRPVPWCENGFYYDADRDQPSRHPFYYAGLYYLQEPSATLPAALLPVKPGNRVLDLCAAPGGKSTELAAKLAGKGFLLANDISATRCKALIKNLELFGVRNAVVTAETPERLSARFPDFFDRILIDAPCSGEGMFRKSQAMVNDWTKEKPTEYAALQREILDFAIKMLRPGGMILYSTCTFAPEEDEGSVQYLLTHPIAVEKNLHLVAVPEYPGFMPGHPEWIPDGMPELAKTVHLFPYLVEGEGHFAALFVSDIRDAENASAALSETELDPDTENDPEAECDLKVDFDPEEDRNNRLRIQKLCPEFAAFAENMTRVPPAQELKLKEGYLSWIASDIPDLKGLRVMRQGLYLGEVKKNRFEPSQALAMALSKDEFRNTISLSPADDRVIRYLKGETIFLTEEEEEITSDGWILILIDRYPLGFGKLNRGSIKNRYLPGWRME